MRDLKNIYLFGISSTYFIVWGFSSLLIEIKLTLFDMQSTRAGAVLESRPFYKSSN